MNFLVKLVILLAIAFSAQSFAYTECPIKIDRYYVGDSGNILWLNFEKGGSAHIEQTDKNFEVIFSTVLAAKIADKQLVIRFKQDGVQCYSDHRRDIRGLWLL